MSQKFFTFIVVINLLFIFALSAANSDLQSVQDNPDPGSARVIKVEGDVRMREMLRYLPLTLDSDLSTGRSIRSKNGSAQIQSGDSIIEIKPNTRVNLSKLFKRSDSGKSLKESKNLSLYMTDGSLSFKVSKLGARGESFEVRSPVAVVGVRGTSVDLSYSEVDQEVDIVVIEGVVEIESVDQTAEPMVVQVSPGEPIKTVTASDSYISPVQIVGAAEAQKVVQSNSSLVASYQQTVAPTSSFEPSVQIENEIQQEYIEQVNESTEAVLESVPALDSASEAAQISENQSNEIEYTPYVAPEPSDNTPGSKE
jgi:hypothetical protein